MASRRRRIPSLQPCGTGAVMSTEYPERKRTDRKPDAERLGTEPWRANGYGSGYRAARQAVIERQHGRCARCGKQVAVKHGSSWQCQGGQVHHVTALCDGGTESRENLVLLCASCHGLVDAARRRAEGSGTV